MPISVGRGGVARSVVKFAFKINELFIVDGHPLGDGDPARGCTLEPLRNFPLPMVMLDERRGKLKLAHPTKTVPTNSSELLDRSMLPTSTTPGAWSFMVGTCVTRTTSLLPPGVTMLMKVQFQHVDTPAESYMRATKFDVTWCETCFYKPVCVHTSTCRERRRRQAKSSTIFVYCPQKVAGMPNYNE